MADPTAVPDVGVAPLPLVDDLGQAAPSSRPPPSPAADHAAAAHQPISTGDSPAPNTDTAKEGVSARAGGAVISPIPAATKDTNIAMADAATESTTAAAVAAPAESPKTTEVPAAVATETKADDAKSAADAEPAPAVETPAAKATETTKAAEATEATATEAAATEAAAEAATEAKDDAPPAEAAPAAADTAADAGADAEADAAKPAPAKLPKSASSSSVARRKSVNQKLNRKGSKARITHIDAKPGEHYFVKLKGYPAWPVIVCDEDMLPQTLIKSRPVSAARADGTYREDYADGGRRAHDRVFPVMYLFTNEFGWVPNTDMHDLDPEKVLDSINDKMRKDLQGAHRLAAENHPLSHYKDLLRQFQEELEQIEEAKRQALATPKKSKKAAAKDGDVDMLDVPADDDNSAPVPKKSASKKRKAEDDAKTPQRADSAKKPKIKITSSGTPKSGTPKSGATNGTSSKSEAELLPEEKKRRKAKEVLFLRHKIQKGLLTRDQAPKEEEMKVVSDYLTKLEAFPDLEVGVIRETKINKVLKAILKIATIPREEEFRFKPRSQALLDEWNKILAAEPAPEPTSETAAPANGTTTNGKPEEKEEKVSSKTAEPEKADEENKAEPKEEAAGEPAQEATEPSGESAPVEASA